MKKLDIVRSLEPNLEEKLALNVNVLHESTNELLCRAISNKIATVMRSTKLNSWDIRFIIRERERLFKIYLNENRINIIVFRVIDGVEDCRQIATINI